MTRLRTPDLARGPGARRVGQRIGSRGVSLIEALVAIAIMAFGMLGLAGLQSSLRANADISKQRSEAVRIAQESLEAARTYSAFAGYAALADVPASTVVGISSNTEYTRTVTVTTLTGEAVAPRKEIVVQVSWVDRLNSNPPPSVTLSTVISGVPPAMYGSLSAPWVNAPLHSPGGRHRAIPRQAKLLQGGFSAFKPPQPTGSDTVVWVFDNTTALLKSCAVLAGSTLDSVVTVSDLGETCVATPFDQQLLSGYVRFAAEVVSLDQAKLPTGTRLSLDMTVTLTSTGHPGDPVCFDDAPTGAAEAGAPGAAVAYYCAIPKRTQGTWAGRSRIRPLGWPSQADAAWVIHGTNSGAYQVCRYTTMTQDTFANNDGKTNLDHPLDYVDTATRSVANQALTQQNFLVIRAGQSCPSHSPTADEAVNANTLLHQDGGVTYNNPA